MSFIVRAADMHDLPAIYRMAKSAGDGFTNLPPDRPTLHAKLERAVASFAREEDALADDLFLFVLEDLSTGNLRGTCQIFACIGSVGPFYSYRITTFTQHSNELDRTIRAEMLVLSTDLEGASEVGGLFLHPAERSSGVGGLLARSRYLFIRTHRARFADKTIAELRGAHDEAGGSPFWDAVAGRFFEMSFREADEFNARHGNQFIADLMPKHPIYTAILPDSARAVIGMPHRSGGAAKRMLEKEGFAFTDYVDIFDAGPAMICSTDNIATIRDAHERIVSAIADPGADAELSLLAHGRLAGFRACYAQVGQNGDNNGIVLDPAAASALRVSVGDSVSVAPH